MIRSRTKPIDSESPFSVEELFFSTTDSKGIITFGNHVFKRISGYNYDELIGEPHNLIRHPNVPRCVFKLLWDYIEAGKPIGAYVKNLAKDGKYYWVFALVMPSLDGYISIRLKPTSPIFETVKSAYADIVQFEQGIEDSESGSQKEAMEQSLALTLETLSSIGFSNYDEFMFQAFTTEMNSRAAAISNGKATPANKSIRRSITYDLGDCCSILNDYLQLLYGRLENFSLLHDDLIKKSKYFLKLANSISRLSLNAIVEANRLEASGATLSVVAESLGRNSNTSAELMDRLNRVVGNLTEKLNPIVFEITSAKLKIEVINQFYREIKSTGEIGSTGGIKTTGGDSNDDSKAAEEYPGELKGKLQHNIELLLDVFATDVESILPRLSEFEKILGSTQDQIEDLEHLVMTLHFVHLTGKVEASRNDETRAFVIIFQEVDSQIEHAKNELKEFRKLIDRHLARFSGLRQIDNGVRDTLTSVLENTSLDRSIRPASSLIIEEENTDATSNGEGKDQDAGRHPKSVSGDTTENGGETVLEAVETDI